jgi:hypothetical protein
MCPGISYLLLVVAIDLLLNRVVDGDLPGKAEDNALSQDKMTWKRKILGTWPNKWDNHDTGENATYQGGGLGSLLDEDVLNNLGDGAGHCWCGLGCWQKCELMCQKADWLARWGDDTASSRRNPFETCGKKRDYVAILAIARKLCPYQTKMS